MFLDLYISYTNKIGVSICPTFLSRTVTIQVKRRKILVLTVIQFIYCDPNVSMVLVVVLGSLRTACSNEDFAVRFFASGQSRVPSSSFVAFYDTPEKVCAASILFVALPAGKMCMQNRHAENLKYSKLGLQLC